MGQTPHLLPAARAGTVGTIQLVYQFVDDVYEIRFDGHTRPQMLRVHELERVATLP